MEKTAVKVTDLVFERPRGAFRLAVSRFEVAAGEKVFLHGPSGGGKSTFLALIAGILKPRQGEIVVDQSHMTGLSGPARDRLRGEKIGLIFQQFNLVPYLGIIDNVILPCRFSPQRLAAAQQGEGSVRAAAERLVGRLGLEPALLSRPVTALSVGQQQRVAAARALMGRPPLLLADEPTSALDSELRLNFLSLLLRECSEAGAGLLFVSHDRSLAADFDRELALSDLVSESTSLAHAAQAGGQL
ncbi:MAG: ATP-binding cassette domain-containing protein [Deltaproteobacteria bacterium]|nr:ATP-binding cassette domain-containing protein [Deltaproteobacteria bacterium]